MFELDKNTEYKAKSKEQLKEELNEMIKGLREKGVLSEQQRLELLMNFEDLDDQFELSAVERYKKAYKNERIEKCVNEILEIFKEHGKNFRKAFLLNNCLKNPMGFSYSEKDYKLTQQILVTVYHYAKDNQYDKIFLDDLSQFIILTDAIYRNNQSNTNRLNQNSFSKYSLSEQIRMICIYLQDQSRLMKEISINKSKKSSFTTGMEMIVSDMPVDHYKNNRVSLVDNYEGLLEYFDILIKYLYATKKGELKHNNDFNHGDIHHFNIPSFEEITYIAMQRVMFLNMEEKFRYSQWNLKVSKTEDNHQVYLFKAKDVNKFQAHIVATIRRRYRLTMSCIKNSYMLEDLSFLKAIEQLADGINIFEPSFMHLDKELYNSARLCVNPLISTYKKTTKPFYLQCNFDGIQVEDIIKTFEFLYTISQVYMKSVLKVFNQKEYSHYKYLVPIVKVDDIILPLANLYDIKKDYARKLIKKFTLDQSIHSDGDIFTRPLISIGNSRILFCETLIEQINLERLLEMLFTKYEVDLAPMGKEFEKKLISKLSKVPNIKVNTNTVAFHAYDDMDVEFDFIGTLEDYLLLFEFKSVTTPYSDKQLYKAEQTIKEGVDQVLRRSMIVQKDWSKIKELSNIELPDTPFVDEKIIKVICTNIFDFTTLIYDGVRITDESTLLKYFTDPYVGVLSGNDPNDVLSFGKIWKDNMPTAIEFISYLDNPVTVGCIPQCLNEEYKYIPYFDGEAAIAFVGLDLNEDPYKKSIDISLNKKKRVVSKKKKIGRNDLCSCGSGQKYKKCCGK